MKVKKKSKAPKFPLKYKCWSCRSVLEIEERDLKVRETLGENKFCGVDCPVCGMTGPTPVSDGYEAEFLSKHDTVGNLFRAIFR